MSSYLSLVWTELSSSICFAFVGLLIGAGVIFLLKKGKYLERQSIFLKLLTKFYFVYFPFVFFFSIWFLGSLWTTAKLFENEITEVVTEIEHETYPVFIKFMNKRVDGFLAKESLPTNGEIVSIFIDEKLDENSSNIYQYTMKVSLTTLLEYMIGKDSEREKRMKILSGGVSTSLLKVGFDFLKEEIKRNVKQVLVFLLIPIIIGFLGAMSFPAIEIFISNKFLKREE
jgi:hypothetical protein